MSKGETVGYQALVGEGMEEMLFEVVVLALQNALLLTLQRLDLWERRGG